MSMLAKIENIKWKLVLTALIASSINGCSSQPKKPDEIATADSAPQGRSPHVPDLSHAQVKVLWVPDKIEQDRWEEGHYLYVIDKPSTWSSK